MLNVFVLIIVFNLNGPHGYSAILWNSPILVSKNNKSQMSFFTKMTSTESPESTSSRGCTSTTECMIKFFREKKSYTTPKKDTEYYNLYSVSPPIVRGDIRGEKTTTDCIDTLIETSVSSDITRRDADMTPVKPSEKFKESFSEHIIPSKRLYKNHSKSSLLTGTSIGEILFHIISRMRRTPAKSCMKYIQYFNPFTHSFSHYFGNVCSSSTSSSSSDATSMAPNIDLSPNSQTQYVDLTSLEMASNSSLNTSNSLSNDSSDGTYEDTVISDPMVKKSNLSLVTIGNKYYHIHIDNKVNFFGAFHFCRRHHMELLSIESKEEEDAVSTFLNESKISEVWTSGTDLDEEGKFVWLSTGKTFDHVAWGPNQPDNTGSIEDCVQLILHPLISDVFAWEDVVCDLRAYFICEVASCTDFCINEN